MTKAELEILQRELDEARRKRDYYSKLASKKYKELSAARKKLRELGEVAKRNYDVSGKGDISGDIEDYPVETMDAVLFAKGIFGPTAIRCDAPPQIIADILKGLPLHEQIVTRAMLQKSNTFPLKLLAGPLGVSPSMIYQYKADAITKLRHPHVGKKLKPYVVFSEIKPRTAR